MKNMKGKFLMGFCFINGMNSIILIGSNAMHAKEQIEQLNSHTTC